MAPGIKRLRQLLFGRETTPNTLIAATKMWRGAGAIQDDREDVDVEDEDIGLIDGEDRKITTGLGGSLKLDAIPATFEQLPLLFMMGMGGPHTGVADGIGTGKVYTNTIPTTSGVTAKPCSVEGGDNFEVETLEGAHCTKIEIVGAQKKPITMAGELMGRQVAPKVGGFTAGVLVPTVHDMVMAKTKFYLDVAGGTYGATLISTSVIGFKLIYEFYWRPVDSGDGDLPPEKFVYVGHQVTGEILFHHDTAARGLTSGEKLNWRNKTPRRLQIKNEGDALTTPGTYTYFSALFNLPIKWSMFDTIGEDRGISTVLGKFRSRYNATVGDAGNAIFVNQEASIIT
jgi:hypothetical protein